MKKLNPKIFGENHKPYEFYGERRYLGFLSEFTFRVFKQETINNISYTTVVPILNETVANNLRAKFNINMVKWKTKMVLHTEDLVDYE